VAIASSAYSDPSPAPAVTTAVTPAPGPEALAPGVGEKLVSAASTTGKPITRAELGVVAFMTAVATVAYVIAALWIADDDSSKAATWFKPASGVTVFAIFYVLAQAIERSLTPLAKLVPTTPPEDAPAEAKGVLGLTTRSRALRQRSAAVEACADPSQPEAAAQQQAREAANWHEILQQTYVNASTVWALGAAFAFLLCAWLDVYLLNAIAVDRWDPPIWIDLLVTGLAIGGGTVPLHNLIDRVQKKDDRQSSSTATSPTPGGGRAGVAVQPERS
jgi:hypothetical protein